MADLRDRIEKRVTQYKHGDSFRTIGTTYKVTGRGLEVIEGKVDDLFDFFEVIWEDVNLWVDGNTLVVEYG